MQRWNRGTKSNEMNFRTTIQLRKATTSWCPRLLRQGAIRQLDTIVIGCVLSKMNYYEISMLTRKRDEAVAHDADAVEKNTSAGSTALWPAHVLFLCRTK